MTAAIDSLLATRDGVRRSAIRALGQSDIADLPTLQQAMPPPGGEASSQAAFTTSLVAYRGGVAGFELPVPDDTHIRAIPNDQNNLFPILQSATTAADFALVSDLSDTELYL